MRFNLRIKFGEFTVFGMIARTQTLEGVTSLQSDGSHIVMWDLENCILKEAERTLKRVQKKYCLSHIGIFSDVEGSYRAWCFSRVDFSTYLKILLDTDHLDYNFFYWTVIRGKATLRTSTKKNRQTQKLITVLESYSVPLPSGTIQRVVYDTGTEKRGYSLLLGGRDG